MLLHHALDTLCTQAHDTIAKGMQATSRDLCRETDFSGKLDSFESQMSTVANLEMSRKQFNWTQGFYEALDTDTSLYGTDGFECASGYGLSGSKENWNDENETFFPGYCEARIQAEIKNRKQATCTHRQCECAKILGIKVCWLAKICLDVGDPCPEYTGDLEMELNDYNSESEELYSAEEQNQSKTNETFPSISESVSTAAADTIGKVMYQVNVASTAYAFYSLCGLFFPSPLLMFRLPLEFYIKRYLFGIHKPIFIFFMVALWWGIEYFKPFWMNPEIQLYLRMLRIGDPCMFDSDFIKAKVSVIKDICDELMTAKDQFVTNTLAINRLSAGVGFFFNSCNCTFPNQNLVRFQTPEYIFLAQAREMGFVREMDGLCEPPTCNRIFLPAEDNPFLGETSMCSDTTIARQYLFVANSDDVETNWLQLLWVTGFLSKILIKVVVTNFCITLYRLADPLSYCGGRFEWPPKYLFRRRGDAETGTKDPVSSTGMSPKEAAKLRVRKTTSLRIISFKWAIVWGALTHLCLLNLALAPIEDEAVGIDDLIVVIIFFSIALISVIALICLRRFLRRHGLDQSINPSNDKIKPISDENERASPLLETNLYPSNEKIKPESNENERASPLLETSIEVPLNEKDENV
jgi:hypothetical protein